jgi:simple sugar transport system ATP-binding protein
MSGEDFFLQTRNLVKSFGTVLALRGVNFRVGRNEVVGLLGDNGAGKSTLIKVISGAYSPDAGEIEIKGKRYHRLTPALARELGIEVVHQERTLAENHSIWRNIFMGRELTTFGFLRKAEMRSIAERVLREMGFASGLVTADTPVKALSGGFKQGVQIARALTFPSDLILMDEPTIQLSISEAQKVMQFIAEARKRGRSCVVVSHNIAHVYPVADRIVIMNRGKILGEFYTRDIALDQLSDVLLQAARTGSIPREYTKYGIISSE